jgi:hypothetical protein
MSENYSYAGQFTFDKIKLFASSGNVIDISRIVTFINLYEDLYKSCITGNITIVDTNNVIMEAPVIGQEFLGFKLITPGLDDFALDYSTHVFTITKINSRTSPNPGTMVYSLAFSSPEGLRDNRTRVSKSYTDSIDSIVENVLSSAKYINTKKTLFMEETKGIKKMVVPYQHPFKLINQLKMEAVSKKHDSPHYMFYENTLGFHFRTLDSLYAQKATAEFNAGDMGGDVSLEDELKRVLQFQIVGSNDMLINVVTGMLASNVLTHDIYRKEYKHEDFEYISDFHENNRAHYDDMDKDNPIYNDVPIDEFDNTVSEFTDAKRYFHPTSTIINNSDAQHYDENAGVAVSKNSSVSYNNPYTANNISKTIMSRKSKLAELTQGVSVLLRVHGTTQLNVGAMVNFNLPITGAKHSGEDNDKYLSGKYIIKSLRHMFEFTEKRHSCAMTLVKDSISSELPMNDLAIEPKAESRGVISEFYS